MTQQGPAPSVPTASARAVWSALLPLLLLGMCAGFLREGSGDFHWHLVLGDQTLRNGGVVRTDAFSHTVHGQPVFVSAWLSDVLLALTFRLGGYVACFVLRGLCIAATLILLARAGLRRGAPPVVVFTLGVIAFAGALPRLYLRPECFAFPLFALVLWLLGEEEASPDRRRLAAIVGIMALWANLHGSAIVGLSAIGLFGLERAVRAQRAGDRRAVLEGLGVPVLALAATCLNPEGVRLPLAVRVVSPAFSTFVAEWRPLSWQLLSTPQIISWALALITTLLAGRRVSPWRFGVVAVLSVLTVRYHRFTPFLLYATVPLVAANLATLLPRRDPPTVPDLLGRMAIGAVGLGFAAVVCFGPRGLTERMGTGLEPGAYPEAACRYARKLALPGKMLNTYDLGSYLMFCLPDTPVFIDQRAWSAYPDRFYEEYLAAFESAARTRALADRYDIDWAFVTADQMGENMAADRQTWRLLYFDDEALIFVRADRGPGAQIAAQQGFREISPLFLVGMLNADPPTLERAQVELEEQRRRCPDCWRTALVDAALAIARDDTAELRRAMAALSRAGERPEIVFLQARAADKLGDPRTAAALYARLRVIGQRPLSAALLQAEALIKAGDRAAAARVFDEAEAMPGGREAVPPIRAQLLGAPQP